MADKELAKVRTTFVEGVSKGVIQQLVDDLLESKILNDGEAEEVNDGCPKTTDKARCLIDMVRKKGRVSSEKFIGLLENRDANLYKKLHLSPTAMVSTTSSSETTVEQPMSDVLIQSTERFKREILQKTPESIYPSMAKAGRQRLALLINNVTFDQKNLLRKGADKDLESMKTLLNGLGYHVEIFRDISAMDMDKAVKEFATRQEHMLSDSTFVVIMSHGKRDGIFGIHHKDNSPDVFSIDKIFTHLNNQNCAGLRNKPKIILIQACRGDESGSAWVCDDIPEPSKALEDDSLKMDHKEKDFASLMSCTPDTKSYRHVTNGSVFIQRLVEIFNTYAHEDHIEELFRKVMNRFKDFPEQMPCKDRVSLTKYFYLFPGL